MKGEKKEKISLKRRSAQWEIAEIDSILCKSMKDFLNIGYGWGSHNFRQFMQMKTKTKNGLKMAHGTV